MIESKVASVILEFEFESPGHLVEVQILFFFFEVQILTEQVCRDWSQGGD